MLLFDNWPEVQDKTLSVKEDSRFALCYTQSRARYIPNGLDDKRYSTRVSNSLFIVYYMYHKSLVRVSQCHHLLYSFIKKVLKGDVMFLYYLMVVVLNICYVGGGGVLRSRFPAFPDSTTSHDSACHSHTVCCIAIFNIQYRAVKNTCRRL